MTHIWNRCAGWSRRYAAHADPLAELGNWAALLIGTHLPFWPFYVWWSAGRQALPSAWLTMALTPVFCLVPLLAKRSGLAGRVAMLVLGMANTVFVNWVLGGNSGTVLFLAPCAALAAMLFRRSERIIMLTFTMTPLLLWYILRHHAPEPLHIYDPHAAHSLFLLNIISIAVLAACFGWLQAEVYGRMEKS